MVSFRCTDKTCPFQFFSTFEKADKHEKETGHRTKKEEDVGDPKEPIQNPDWRGKP